MKNHKFLVLKCRFNVPISCNLPITRTATLVLLLLFDMAARPPAKAAAKPKPGVNKRAPPIKQLTPEEKRANEIKEAFAVWDTGIYHVSQI